MSSLLAKLWPRSWQVRLVLLLIGCLAGVGLVLLRQDRRLAEQEAQLRAQDLAEALARECRIRLNNTLNSFIVGAEGSRQAALLRAEGQLNPVDTGREVRALTESNLAGAVERGSDSAKTNVASPNPRLLSDVLPRVQCLVRDGHLIEPPDVAEVPQPPDWLLSAPHEPLRKLEQGKAAAARGDKDGAGALFNELLKSDMRSLRAAAEMELASLAPASKRASELCAVAGQSHGLTADSGAPLSDLALLRAIESLSEGDRLEAVLTQGVLLLREYPSWLTPRWLSALEERSRSQAAGGRESVAALMALWRMDQRARGLLQEWLSHHSPRTGACRLQMGREEFFLFSHSAPVQQTNIGAKFQSDASDESGISNASDTLQKSALSLAPPGGELQVSIIPSSVVESALRLGASEVTPRWPAYFDATVEFAGRVFLLNPLNLADQRERASRRILATQNDEVTNSTWYVTQGKQLISQSSAGGLRGIYPFAATVGLIDPALMLSQHQRRVWWFGFLIVVSASVAAAGAWLLQRNLDAQLQLSEAKTNFVSSVSHELRAPIAAVRLMAESLERGKITGQEKQAEYYRFIVQECRRLSALIENVLDFSRIEQGRKEYQFEPTDVVVLVQQTVKLMETYAAEKQVKLELAGSAATYQVSGARPSPGAAISERGMAQGYSDACNPPDVAAPGDGRAPLNLHEATTGELELSVDGRAIQQALVNLIDNAIKHSPKGGTVRVGVERLSDKSDQSDGSDPSDRAEEGSAFSVQEARRASRVCLWVEDRGEGIPAEEHQKIFERFYRRGPELRRETQGVGIGLSIVKHIVDSHGGRVLVRSKVGDGSRFTIELPLAAMTNSE